MRASRWMLMIAGLAIAACSNDPVAPDDTSLVGTWNATEWWFTNQANATQSIEIISLGASISVVVDDDLNYTATTATPTGPETYTGTLQIAGNIVTFTDLGDGPAVYTMEMSGSTLILTTSDEAFDFDLDGQDEPADMRLLLTRA